MSLNDGTMIQSAEIKRDCGNMRWLAAMALSLVSGSWAAAAPETGINLEIMAANDVILADCLAYLVHSKGEYETVLSFNHADFWIDYRPSGTSLIGDTNDRHESKDSLRLALQGPLGKDLLWLVEGGGYLGFDDFQSVWIDEYYRQTFEDYTGYEAGDPKGVDGLLGLRWDYLQTSGFAKFSVFAGHDRISPQWEPVIGQGLTPSRSSFDSIGGRIEFENVLTRRFRTNNRLTMSDISERAPRWSFETMDNFALSDSWVIKGTMGCALENPDFHAFWTTAAVEWDFQQKWFVGLNARFYQDSGETDDLILYGVDAPPATTFGASVTLRWIEGQNQAALGIGPYWSEYDRQDATSPVAELFTDRSWLWIQLAWSRQF
jgi:hypothetical protein